MKFKVLHKYFFLFESHAAFRAIALLISSFPILPYGVRSVCTMSLLFVSILIAIKKPGIKNVNSSNLHLKALAILSAPFVILIVSLFYSNNLNEGINSLTHMLSLLAFPIILFLVRDSIDNKLVKDSCVIFITSVILLVLYQLFTCISNYTYLTANLSQSELILNNIKEPFKTLDIDIINKIKIRRFRTFLIDKTDTHPTYLGMWIVFSFFILFKTDSLVKYKPTTRLIYLFVSALLLTWLFMIASRISLIAFIITFVFSNFLYVEKKTSPKKLVFSSGLIVLFVATCYVSIPSFKNRVHEFSSFGLNMPTKGADIYNFNSSNVRFGVYYCSYKRILEAPFLGTGIGDVQEELNHCYSNEVSAIVYTWRDHNSHNQFLFFTLSAGLFGLLVFIFTLFYQVRKALKDRNNIYLCFLIIIICFSLTENILVRSDGVVFYAFFSSLFMFNSKYGIS